MSKTPRYLETPPDWTPEEQPTLPGSPAAIAHSVPKRFLYFLLVCLSLFQQAQVMVSLRQIYP